MIKNPRPTQRTFSSLLVLALLCCLGATLQLLPVQADGPIPFVRHTVEGLDSPSGGTMVDLDQDGDADLLKASDYGSTIAWWKNDGNQGFTRQIIATGFGRAKTARAADLDGDDDLDVLSVAGTSPSR